MCFPPLDFGARHFPPLVQSSETNTVVNFVCLANFINHLQQVHGCVDGRDRALQVKVTSATHSPLVPLSDTSQGGANRGFTYMSK